MKPLICPLWAGSVCQPHIREFLVGDVLEVRYGTYPTNSPFGQGWVASRCLSSFWGDVLEHMIGHITYQQSFQAGLGGVPLLVHILQGSIESGGCSGGDGAALSYLGSFQAGLGGVPLLVHS